MYALKSARRNAGILTLLLLILAIVVTLFSLRTPIARRTHTAMAEPTPEAQPIAPVAEPESQPQQENGGQQPTQVQQPTQPQQPVARVAPEEKKEADTNPFSSINVESILRSDKPLLENPVIASLLSVASFDRQMDFAKLFLNEIDAVQARANYMFDRKRAELCAHMYSIWKSQTKEYKQAVMKETAFWKGLGFAGKIQGLRFVQFELNPNLLREKYDIPLDEELTWDVLNKRIREIDETEFPVTEALRLPQFAKQSKSFLNKVTAMIDKHEEAQEAGREKARKKRDAKKKAQNNNDDDDDNLFGGLGEEATEEEPVEDGGDEHDVPEEIRDAYDAIVAALNMADDPIRPPAIAQAFADFLDAHPDYVDVIENLWGKVERVAVEILKSERFGYLTMDLMTQLELGVLVKFQEYEKNRFAVQLNKIENRFGVEVASAFKELDLYAAVKFLSVKIADGELIEETRADSVAPQEEKSEVPVAVPPSGPALIVDVGGEEEIPKSRTFRKKGLMESADLLVVPIGAHAKVSHGKAKGIWERVSEKKWKMIPPPPKRRSPRFTQESQEHDAPSRSQFLDI